MNNTILCVDIGTSSLKAALIDDGGKTAAFSHQSYSYESRHWLAAFYKALEEIAALAPGQSVAALVVSGNGPTLVPVGTVSGGSPDEFGLAWFGAGLAPAFKGGPSLFLPHVAAFKERYPALYDKTAFFLSSQEWLCWKLGAEPVTVLPSPEYEPYYWDAAQCEAYTLDIAKFRPFVPLGSRTGEVKKEAAYGRLLPEGTPIISGGPDFIMALIGTGVLEKGMICDRAGSSEGINLCIAKADLDRFTNLGQTAAGSSLRLLPHPAVGLYNAGFVISKSGRLWAEQPGDEALKAMAAQVKSGLDLFRAAGFGGEKPFELIVSGGQGKSAEWNQKKADMTGASLLIPEMVDGELAGDAVLGLLYLEGGANGGYPSPEALRAAAGRVVRIASRFQPHSMV